MDDRQSLVRDTGGSTLTGRGGDPLDPLFAVAYSELHSLAHSQRRQWRGQTTLNTTALVHEVYLKLAHQEQPLHDSRCLFAIAAKAMRHVLVNHAERQKALKRGGDMERVRLAELGGEVASTAPCSTADEIIALDAALERLAAMSPRQSRVVECRFFGGLSVEETAAALEVSTATVKRDWRLASAWLLCELASGASAS